MKHQKIRNNRTLPFSVIAAASQGDADAMSIILNYYSGYINKLSTRSARNKAGKTYSYIDEELRSRLKLRLIMRTLTFNI